MVGGDLAMLLMRTGNGKTTVSLSMAREAARKIKNGEIKGENPVIVFVTLEQQAEYMEFMLSGSEEFDSSQLIRGKVDPNSYKAWSIKRGGWPLWVIGQSRRWSHVKQPQLFLEVIIEGINGIKYEYGYNPILIYVDYLQKLRLKDGTWNNMNQQVIEASRALKQMAMDLDTPVVFGSQANQKVDSYADKIPKLSDSMWASESTHEPDFVISGVRLANYWDPSTHPYVPIDNVDYPNSGKTLILQIQKQRFDRGWGTISVDFTPQTLHMEDVSQTFNINDAQDWAQGDMFNDNE